MFGYGYKNETLYVFENSVYFVHIDEEDSRTFYKEKVDKPGVVLL